MKTIMNVLAVLVIAAYGYAADATYVAPGRQVNYTPSADISAGDVVIQLSMAGVATTAIESNELGSISVVGVFDIVQAAEAITAGDPVYWDDDGSPYGGTVSNGAATATSTANTFIGFALATSATNESTVRVVLNSSIVSAASAGTFTVGTLAVQTNATVGGTLAVTGATTLTGNGIANELDARTATAILLGKATATGVTLGASDADTTVTGDLYVSGGQSYLGATDGYMGYWSLIGGTNLAFVATYTNGAAISPNVTNAVVADITN